MTQREKRRTAAASGKGTEIGAMNYACQESKRGYTCNIDRRNAALRIWSVYAARYRENTRGAREHRRPGNTKVLRREKHTVFSSIRDADTGPRQCCIPRHGRIIARGTRRSSRKRNNGPREIERDDYTKFLWKFVTFDTRAALRTEMTGTFSDFAAKTVDCCLIPDISTNFSTFQLQL